MTLASGRLLKVRTHTALLRGSCVSILSWVVFVSRQDLDLIEGPFRCSASTTPQVAIKMNLLEKLLIVIYSPLISKRKVTLPNSEHLLLFFSCAKCMKCCPGFEEQQRHVSASLSQRTVCGPSSAPHGCVTLVTPSPHFPGCKTGTAIPNRHTSQGYENQGEQHILKTTKHYTSARLY